jgi:iron complex outermembrane receptor protein
LGARYDRYQSFGHTWNPRSALVWRPWEDGTWKFLYGSAFRAPNPYELLYADPDYSKTTKLLPEKLTTYEAAYSHRFGGGTDAEVSYFQTHLKDLIGQTSDPATGNVIYRNQQNVRTDGMELSCRRHWETHWDTRLGYTLQNSRVVGGDRLSNSPVHTGTVSLAKLFPSRDASLALSTFFVGSRRTVRDTWLPATAVLTLHGRMRLWEKGPYAYAGVRNLTDADYRASGAEDHTMDAIPQDGINWSAGLEWRFASR